MKKSILALAVAAALAAPLAAQADTILYGSARVSVDYNDEDPADGYWDVVNNDSRLGVQGSEDLGGGLAAIYQMEFGVDLTEGGNFESNRPKFVGLKGGFGTVTLGTQETPYYHVVGVTDIFNTAKSFGETAWLGGTFNGFLRPTESSGRPSGSLTRQANSLYYLTPDLSGFSAEAMLVMDGSRNDSTGTDTGYSDGIDLWNIALKYSNGPFFAGVSYIKLNGGNDYADTIGANPPIVRTLDYDLDQWVVGLGYSAGAFSLGFIYEQGTFNEFGFASNMSFNGVRWGGDDATNYYLTGSYTFGNNVISAAYGYLDPGTQGANEIQNYILGYQYNLSKRTRLWVEYIGRNADPDVTLEIVSPTQGVFRVDPYGDQNAFSIGTRVDF
jgi:predicted porin